MMMWASETLALLSAVAAFPAVAFFPVIHRAVFAGLFAIRLVRRETYRANRCRQNRKQDFHVILHSFNLVRDIIVALAKKEDRQIGEKHLNIARFGLIEEGTVKQTSHKVIRLAIVLTTIAAWFSISNHCAVGALVVTTAQSVPQMHCHGSEPSPTKKSSDEEMPCCKLLRATLADQGKIVQVASKDFLPIQNWITTEIIFADEAHLHCAPLELDTGPPFAASFAESVLQSSVLAHAPPVFLS